MSATWVESIHMKWTFRKCYPIEPVWTLIWWVCVGCVCIVAHLEPCNGVKHAFSMWIRRHFFCYDSITIFALSLKFPFLVSYFLRRRLGCSLFLSLSLQLFILVHSEQLPDENNKKKKKQKKLRIKECIMHMVLLLSLLKLNHWELHREQTEKGTPRNETKNKIGKDAVEDGSGDGGGGSWTT